MKRICSIAFIALTISVFAQQNINHVFEKLNKQSDIIIEGKVINSEGVWDDKNKTIFTKHTVKSSKIFKGNYADSITYFTTVGGTANNITLSVHDVPSLSKGGTYILFGQRKYETNFVPLLSDEGFVQLFADGVNPPAIIGETHIKNIEKEIYRPLERMLNANMKILAENDLEIRARKMFANYTVPQKEGVLYSLDNLRFLNTTYDSIEFDVFAQTIDFGYKLFSSGEIFFKYDTTLFGQYLASQGDIEILKEAISYSSDYLLSMSDEAPDLIKMTVESINNPKSLYAISSIANPLLKVRLKLPSLPSINSVAFDEGSMQTKSKYIDVTANQKVQFDTVLTRLGLQGARGAGDVRIDLKFQGAKVTKYNNLEALEFDVLIKADIPSSPMQFLQFEVSYNPNVFGNTYPQFTCYPLGVFRTKYNPLLGPPTPPSTMRFGLNYIDNNNLAMVSTQWDSFVHVIMPFQFCGDSAKVKADTTMWRVGTYRLNNGSANYFPILINDSINILLCPDSIPVLYSVSPEIVRAGIKDTLTFIGKNIMPDTANGYPLIFFTNADKPSIQVFVDGVDLIKVSDSIIQLVVPSNIELGGTAGSCKPRLQISALKILQSPDSIVVDYALLNIRRGTSSVPAHRVNLYNQNGNGGHTIRYNPTFNSNTAAVKCYERALQDWKCATGVNFVIGSSTSISANAIDSVNVVNFATSLPDSTALAVSYVTGIGNARTLQCFGPNSIDTINQIIDFDMFFKSTVNWHYDTTGSIPCPAGKYDFYTVALHELGHAHQITHVLDESKVMHYNLGAATQRQLTASDVNAGINVVSYSINPDGSPCLPPMVQVSISNCVSAIKNLDIVDSKLSLFPNPNNGTFSVTIDSGNDAVSNFFVSNTVGQKLIEQSIPHSTGTNNYQFQLSNLSSGIYFISFVIDGKTKTKKLIIQ